jgi:prepilin-type N-terminal cleavage/methylation domain-containing protein
MQKRNQIDGFTLVELCVVMVVMGILAVLTYSVIIPRYRERTYYTRSITELNAMGNATKLYLAKYNTYPDDVTRDVPAGIKEFVQGQATADNWPDAPWPGSIYDYDNWPPDSNGPIQTYQISVRFCNAGDDATCKKLANKYLKDYVPQSTLDNWDSYSAVYYCLSGSCRSHQTKPISHPGYCVNCGGKNKVF